MKNVKNLMLEAPADEAQEIVYPVLYHRPYASRGGKAEEVISDYLYYGSMGPIPRALKRQIEAEHETR